MTRVNSLPEPKHKSQLCFTIRQVICGSWLKTGWCFDTWNQCWKQRFGGEKSHRSPQWHSGLKVYISIQSSGDSWSKQDMSGGVAWSSQRWERKRERDGDTESQSRACTEMSKKVSATLQVQAIMKECVLKMQSIKGRPWICACNTWNGLSCLTAP